MTRKEKVKKFVKNHKKDIIIYSVYGAFAGIGMGCMIEGIRNIIKINKMKKNCHDLDIPNLTIKDFGKVGEEILSYYDGQLSKDTPIKYWNLVIPTEEKK